MNLEDGFIFDGQIVWHSGVVARGVALSAPSMENAPTSFLSQTETELTVLLSSLPPGITMQLRWSRDAGYHGPLLDYHRMTEAHSSRRWSRRQRNRHYVEFSRQLDSGLLRGQSVYLFLKASLQGGKKRKRGRRHLRQLLEVSAKSFEGPLQEITRMMERLGGEATVLDDAALFGEVHRHFNPTQNLSSEQIQQQFKPEQPLLENCLQGEICGESAPHAGFYCAGVHHGSLVLSGMPQATASGMITQLTSLPLRDYSFTLNLEPLDVIREIEQAENIAATLRRARRTSNRSSMDHDILAAEARIARLSAGQAVPVKVQLILHAWDTTREGLESKLAALRVAVHRMQGAQAYEMALPTSCRNYYLAGIPGSPFHEKSYHHTLDDSNAVHLMPLSGDMDESLEGAEALFHGWQGNLVGVNLFEGEVGDEEPMHAFVSGKTGSGKSVLMMELLTQTDPGSDYLVIIDNGFSYSPFTTLISGGACRPLEVDVNGPETLNCHDTGGLPLNPDHFNEIVTIGHLMAGKKRDEDANHRRVAVLARCSRRFYQDHYEQWRAAHPQRHREVEKTLASMKVHPGVDRHGKDLVNRYTTYREDTQGQAGEKTVAVDMSSLPVEEIRDLAYAFMSPQEMPTHSGFHDWLEEYSGRAERDRDEVDALVTLLEMWRADRGIKGCLLDGVNTVDLSANCVHIELGRIQESDGMLRDIISHVITGKIRNEIMTRPRGQRKRVVIEELGAFLDIRGGKEIVRHFYERMRKYNAVVLSVIQQVSNLPADLARSVLGNCRQAFFLRQKDAGDVRQLQEVFSLPAVTVDMIRRFPKPNAQRGAPFIHWEDNGESVRIRAAFNLTGPETLYVADSSGAAYDKRREALAKYDSVYEGVIAEAHKHVQQKNNL